MKIYNVGSAEFSDWDFNEAEQAGWEWVVFWYEYEWWEGNGELIGLGKNGLLYWKNLSHCSCYGPMDDWETDLISFTVEEFLRVKDSIHDWDHIKEVEAKVRSLLLGE